MDSASKTFSATSSCIPDSQSMIGHSGHGIGNTVIWVFASSAPLGLSFLSMYSAKHEIQYVCSPGHGRRRPNGNLAEEFAARAAEIGE